MIRKMQEADRALFLAMSQDFYGSPAVSHGSGDADVAVFIRTFEEAIREEGWVSGYILEAEGRPVGYALCTANWATEVGGRVCWIEELYVEEAFRGQGLGRAFFAYLREHRPAGLLRFRLEVMPQNTSAQRLYAREGFTPMEYLQMYKDFPLA